MLRGLLSLALAMQIAGVPDSRADAPESESVSPTWAVAVANRARVKTAPSFKVEPDHIRPESARLLGEFGEVVLIGIIGQDGKVREARVKVSSHSDAIDAAALASVPAMLFEPARDAAGSPLDIVSVVSLEYSHVDFHGPRSLAQYRCDQFVRDYDWWYRTWPADKHDRIFETLRGFTALADLRAGNASRTDFEAEWKAAVEACRQSPQKRMLDMFATHGKLLRQMVGAG